MNNNPPTFSIITPNGEIYSHLSRKDALNAISFMPAGSKIDPPIPPGNSMALDLLDSLCK